MKVGPRPSQGLSDSSSLVPGSPAGGDLSGTYPNPAVTDDSHSHTFATLPATAGGDLSGTYPNPSVVDDSHSHTGTTVPGAVGALLISDDHSTPIVFADLLLTEEGDDLLYADVGA